MRPPQLNVLSYGLLCMSFRFKVEMTTVVRINEQKKLNKRNNK